MTSKISLNLLPNGNDTYMYFDLMGERNLLNELFVPGAMLLPPKAKGGSRAKCFQVIALKWEIWPRFQPTLNVSRRDPLEKIPFSF